MAAGHLHSMRSHGQMPKCVTRAAQLHPQAAERLCCATPSQSWDLGRTRACSSGGSRVQALIVDIGHQRHSKACCAKSQRKPWTTGCERNGSAFPQRERERERERHEARWGCQALQHHREWECSPGRVHASNGQEHVFVGRLL